MEIVIMLVCAFLLGMILSVVIIVRIPDGKDRELRRYLGITSIWLGDPLAGEIPEAKTEEGEIERLRKFTKEHKKEVKEMIQPLIDRLTKIDDNQEIVTCDKCKCMIRKCVAVEGKSRIKYKAVPVTQFLITGLKEKEIYTPYYCHRCKPKNRR